MANQTQGAEGSNAHQPTACSDEMNYLRDSLLSHSMRFVNARYVAVVLLTCRPVKPQPRLTITTSEKGLFGLGILQYLENDEKKKLPNLQ